MLEKITNKDIKWSRGPKPIYLFTAQQCFPGVVSYDDEFGCSRYGHPFKGEDCF